MTKAARYIRDPADIVPMAWNHPWTPTEAEFTRLVLQVAHAKGWSRRYHTHDSRRSSRGFPDWVMVNVAQRRILFLETEGLRRQGIRRATRLARGPRRRRSRGVHRHDHRRQGRRHGEFGRDVRPAATTVGRMNKSTVTNVIAFLFGGMVFLLAFTRLGGFATTVFAGAILGGYLLVEGWREWQLRRSRGLALRRLHAMRVADAHRQTVKR